MYVTGTKKAEQRKRAISRHHCYISKAGTITDRKEKRKRKMRGEATGVDTHCEKKQAGKFACRKPITKKGSVGTERVGLGDFNGCMKNVLGGGAGRP